MTSSRRRPLRPVLAACAASSLLVLGSLAAHPITVDGNAADWVGTPSATVHATVTSAGEFIYTGESGDVRNDPSGTIESNADITEVRMTADATNLYILVRLADVTQTDEVYVGVGIDTDQAGGDTSINFQGDESGVTYGGSSALMPEYLLNVHNAVSGTTWVEMRNQASSWYTPGGMTNSFISTSNNLLEFRVALSEIGNPTTIGLTLATFDNFVAFNNDDDTTVDYPTCDALDVMGGTPGSSQGAFTRDLSDGTISLGHNVVTATIVPVEFSAFSLE